MYRKFLSSLLSFTLLFQILWIPGAFARPEEEAGFIVAAENEIRASLIAESSKNIWDQIEEINLKIYGNTSEDKRMEYYQINNPEYQDELIKQFSNEGNWSLRNYLFLYYTNLNKRKRPALVWGIFDAKLRYLPFENQGIQQIVEESKSLVKEVESYLESNAPEEDRISIATWYMINIYGKMIGQLSLFAQEKDAIDQIRTVQSQIRLRIPYPLANKYKDNLKALEITIKNNSYMSFMSDSYLEFTPKMQLDLYTLAAAQIPTAHFYLNASRFRTMKNILKRVDFYKLTLNDFSETPIPNSCRNMMSTIFPTQAPVDEVDEEERIYKMNALLSESGLLLHDSTPESNIRYSSYEEYYKGYYAADMQLYNGGFSGLLPYEDYFASQIAINGNEDLYLKYYDEPQINDVEHFNDILHGKGAQIEQFIAKKAKIRTKDFSHVKSLAESTKIYERGTSAQLAAIDTLDMINEMISASYAIEEIWKKMVMFDLTDELTKVKTANGATIETAGLNHYLAEKMIIAKTNILEDVVPENVNEKMRNTEITIRMPHLNSNDSWRKWAMQLMVEYIDKYVDADINEPFVEEALTSFNQACFYYQNQVGKILSVCVDKIAELPRDHNMGAVRQIMKNIRNKIMPDESESDILPRLSYDMELLNEFYPLLQRVWDSALANGTLPNATVTEWEYLVSQLPYNGWAVLRLSHLLIEDEMKNDQSILYETKSYYKKIIKILKLDSKFQPFHASRMLSKDEKRIFWKDIEGRTDENNFYIYKSRNEDNDKKYYEIIRHINDLNLFNQDNLDYALRIIGSNVNRSELNKEMDKAQGSEVKKEVDYLNQMYDSMEDLDKLQSMSDTYFELFPYTPKEEEVLAIDYNYYIDVKSRFLKHESNLKTPIYHHALKEASYIALQNTQEMMDKLCRYDYLSGGKKNKYSVEREDYNDLFSITSSAHIEFNQEYQIGVPEWAQKFADRMSDEDIKAMLWAFGSAALYLISIPLTGGATLGLSPVAASGLAAGFSIASASLEFLSGGIYEWQVIEDAKKRTNEREAFREFGTMSAETNEKIGFSYIWVALEVCFFSQLLGQVLKGVKLFTRTVYAAQKGAFKGLNHAAKLAKYRGIAKRVLTSNARSILNLNKRIFNTVGDNWFKKGLKALRFEYLRGFKGVITPAKANTQLASVMARYFENSSDQLRNFFKNYPQNRHLLLQKRIKRLQKFGRLRAGTISKLTKEAAKFESGSVIVKELMEKLGRISSTGNLEKFILENVDDICKVTMQLGWTQWKHGAKAGEIFYHVLITGMPAGNKRLPILRNMVNSVPWLATINDRILIQRMISARQILIQDHNIKIMAKQMGLALGDPTKFQIKQSFDELVDRLTRTKGMEDLPESTEEILKLIDDLNEKQAEGILGHYKKWSQKDPKKRFSSITRLKTRELKEMLLQGDPKAIAAYNNTPAHELFGMDIDNDSAFDVMKELSEKIYHEFKGKNNITVEEFEILVNALKMRSMALNPRKYFPELKYTL